MAGLRVETCGYWKDFEGATELFCWATAPRHFALPLKLELDLQLNHSGSYIASQTSTQNARRRLLEKLDLAESLVGNAVIRKTEIGVVEQVEELESNPEHTLLPARNPGVLHEREVGVEVVWSAKAVASLDEGNGGAF